jgi:hypothetical protein
MTTIDFTTVTQFERAIADYFGAPEAVAVDCCTHAVELALRYKKITHATCPTHTYISIPFTLEKCQVQWTWDHRPWSGWYELGDTGIVDAATWFCKDGYIQGKWMALSFQFKKHLKLGRGGMLLLDDHRAAEDLRAMAYDGRERYGLWAPQEISMVGYHYYMTPEMAHEGLEKLPAAMTTPWQAWDWQEYPYLPDKPVFSSRVNGPT